MPFNYFRYFDRSYLVRKFQYLERFFYDEFQNLRWMPKEILKLKQSSEQNNFVANNRELTCYVTSNTYYAR